MAALLFGVGGAIGALSLLLPHPDAFDDAALWSNIALSFAATGVCLFGAARWRLGPLYALVALGVIAVTRAGYHSHDPSGFYTLFYVWIGLYAVFFFSRGVAVLYLAEIALAYAWLLIADDANAAAARWVTTIGTLVLGAVLIDALVGRVRRIARESASIARERADLMAALAEVARTDELTGLPNRRAWDEALTASSPARSASRLRSVSGSSTSIGSRTTTTSTATRPATGCSSSSRPPGATSCGQPTCSPATAARSLRSRCPAATSATRAT